MIQKPSKKIVSLIIVVLAIISGILIIKYGQGKAAGTPSLSYEVTDINTYNSTNVPSNDSQNLNDLLGITDTSSSTEATDTANTSDLVARSLYAGYLSLADKGDTSSDSQQSLAAGIASQVANSFVYKVYPGENLKTITTPTKNEISFFASSLATIQNNILTDLSNEATNNKKLDLHKVSEIYKNAASNVYDLPVPIDIANSDLDIINNYSIVSASYDYLDKGDSNPVMATMAIKYLQDAEKSQRGDVTALANYFKYSGIIFTSEDVGNYWGQFITTPQ